MNKNYGKLVDGVIEYADDAAVVWNNVLYRPVPEEILSQMGYKRIEANVPQYPPEEQHKWVKGYKEEGDAIVYEWTQEEMTDAEYLVYCHNKLNESDWVTSAYIEGALSEDDWNEWKAKRKVWRDFIRSHE